MTYLTPADLAEEFGTTEATIIRWRRDHNWPSWKVGNQIRFSPEHVERIKALGEVKPEPVEAPTDAVVVEGQTARSARSRRTA